MQGLVEERGVNLSVVGEAPDVMGNADALNQIFVNLIENASRFAGEGGHVRVEITCSEGHSVIAVKDDGPGFGDESPDHLFDRFYRAGHGAVFIVAIPSLPPENWKDIAPCAHLSETFDEVLDTDE